MVLKRKHRWLCELGRNSALCDDRAVRDEEQILRLMLVLGHTECKLDFDD